MIKRVFEDIKVVFSGKDTAGYYYPASARIKVAGIYTAVILVLSSLYTEFMHRIQTYLPDIRMSIEAYDQNAAFLFDRMVDFVNSGLIFPIFSGLKIPS